MSVKIIHVAGLLPENCQRVIIDIPTGDVAKIYYQTIADSRFMDIDFGTAFKLVEKDKSGC